MQTQKWCPQCAQITMWIQPECGDGHGPDCPEWACDVCGSAFLLAGRPAAAVAPAPTSAAA